MSPGAEEREVLTRSPGDGKAPAEQQLCGWGRARAEPAFLSEDAGQRVAPLRRPQRRAGS